MRLHLIGCSVILRELSDAIAHCQNTVDARYFPAGLHDKGAKTMHEWLQRAIDEADGAGYDAIALGYGLCGNGLAGLQARTTPLVVARAHDCITLLLGSRARYRVLFEKNSGTYFRSAGWTERASELRDQLPGMGFAVNQEALVEKYGQEAGLYLYEEFTRYERRYSRLAYIRMESEYEDHFLRQARAEAQEKGWEFEEVNGDHSLFRRLLSGGWASDFLLVPPGHRIVATYDDEIVGAARP